MALAISVSNSLHRETWLKTAAPKIHASVADARVQVSESPSLPGRTRACGCSSRAGIAAGDTTGMMDTLVKAVAHSQKEFLKDFNEISKVVRKQSEALEKRTEAHQKKVEDEFTNAMKRLQTDASH